MGRRERKDVDYFPFYIKDGRTLFIMESKYQCMGTGFFTNMMRFLSRTPDHHFQIEKESDKLYFFATTKCDEVSGMDMIEIMVETGKLDRDLWEQKKVLASQDFLDSIQDAYRKRTNSCITIDEIKAFYGITTGRKQKPAEGSKPDIDVDDVTPGEKTPPPEPIVSIPLVDKTEYPIYQTDIEEWQDAFPAVDIVQTLKRIRLWNVDNPKRRKTKKGVRKHITSWLDSEQNKGRGARSVNSIGDHNMNAAGSFLQKEGVIK